MFVEIGAIAGGNYLLYKYLNHQYEKFEKKFNSLVERIPGLTNNKGESLKMLDYIKTEYGYDLKLSLPWGINSKKLEDNLLTLKEGLKLPTINLNYDNGIFTLQAIKHYKYRRFEPSKLKPNELLIAEFMGENIIVDQNKFPHCLIAGDTGTGKSRILFAILTNLINTSKNKVSLYLLQIRKNDLILFKDCKNVKCCSRTLEEVLAALQEVDKELQRRDQILDISKGWLNISEYNLKSGKILKYIYVVIEEFSFLNISKADSKKEKALKAECMKYIKGIVNAGRSSGVFLITSLQKPTSDSIPSDIKGMLTTRVALNIKDAPTCRVVMNDDSAVDLTERQLVCRTKNTQLGYSLTIDFNDIKEYTKDFIVKRPPKEEAPIKVKSDSKNTADDIIKMLGI